MYYWLCMSSTYLALHTEDAIEIGRPPTSKALEVASVKATSFPCLPFPHSHPRPSCLPACLPAPGLACVQTGVHPISAANLRPLSPVVLSTSTYTGGRRRRSQRERKKETLYSTIHTANTTTHTHRQKTQSIHPSIHSLYGHPHRVPWSQSLNCTSLDAALPSRDLFSHAAFRTLGSLQRPARTRPPR
jgi:hypothetical protein